MLWLNILDYLFLVIILFIALKFIYKTEALKFVLGISFIYILSYVTGLIGLDKTSFLLDVASKVLTLSTVLIFYPELRVSLKKLGSFSKPKGPSISTLKIIEDSLFELSKKKHGALIIMDENGDISSSLENSTLIDAKLSPSLIGTLFHPNTPLHDGAVIIFKGRIQYAGSKLPLSARKRSNFGNLGTRHMAAIETAENFNTLVFVVSEETGAIRIVTKKGLHLITTRQDFKDFFLEQYETKKQKPTPNKN